MKLIPKGFKINKLVRHFIISDLMLFGGWGLIAPDLILPPAKKDKVFLANHSPRTIQH